MFQLVLQLCLIFRAALGRLCVFCAARCRVLRKKFRQQDQQHCQNAYCRSKPCSALFSFAFPGKIFHGISERNAPCFFHSVSSCTSSIGAMPSSCCRYAAIRLCSADVHAAGRITSTFSVRTVCSVQFHLCTKAPLTLCAKIRFQPFLRSLQERCLRTLDADRCRSSRRCTFQFQLHLRGQPEQDH